MTETLLCDFCAGSGEAMHEGGGNCEVCRGYGEYFEEQEED